MLNPTSQTKIEEIVKVYQTFKALLTCPLAG